MTNRTTRSFTLLDTLKAIGVVVLITLGGALRRALREAKQLETVHVDLPIHDLPPAWGRVRIVLLADPHARPPRQLDRLSQIVDAALAAQPDLIVLTGDTLSEGAERPGDAVDTLARLTAPMGVFAVRGNHDCRHGQTALAVLAEAGIDCLVNEHRLLTRDNQTLCLAGVDDWRRGDPDVRAALAGVDPATPRILLCHNPDAAEDLPGDLRIDVMLSGHTHGGQVHLWGHGPVALPVAHHKYAAGLVAGPRCPVYVSRGLGTVGLPIRFHCPPEMTILTLRSADSLSA